MEEVSWTLSQASFAEETHMFVDTILAVWCVGSSTIALSLLAVPVGMTQWFTCPRNHILRDLWIVVFVIFLCHAFVAGVAVARVYSIGIQ